MHQARPRRRSRPVVEPAPSAPEANRLANFGQSRPYAVICSHRFKTLLRLCPGLAIPMTPVSPRSGNTGPKFGNCGLEAGRRGSTGDSKGHGSLATLASCNVKHIVLSCVLQVFLRSSSETRLANKGVLPASRSGLVPDTQQPSASHFNPGSAVPRKAKSCEAVKLYTCISHRPGRRSGQGPIELMNEPCCAAFGTEHCQFQGHERTCRALTRSLSASLHGLQNSSADLSLTDIREGRTRSCLGPCSCARQWAARLW